MKAQLKPKPGDVFETAMFASRGLGDRCLVRCLDVYKFGTMDVEIVKSGNCYRVTGLDFILADDPLGILRGEG